jgi:hypothetical protein
MENKNTFVQKNGMVISEGKVYRSHAGDLVKVLNINLEIDQVKVYNISDSCHSWHRICRAITDNKFKTEV